MVKKEGKEELVGLGGWLIVFILWIVFQIYGYISNILLFTFKFSEPTLAMLEQIGFDAALQHPILNAVFSIIPLIFFIYTAILLFKKSDSFIKIAKLAVWISFVADSLVVILLFSKWEFFLIPLQLIPTAILILYLTYSKRVVNTFVKNNKEKAEKLKKIDSINRKKLVIWTIVISVIILFLLFAIGVIKLISFGINVANNFDEISAKIEHQSVDESLLMCNSFTGFTAEIMKNQCISLVAVYNANKTEYRDGKLCNLIEESVSSAYSAEDRDKCFYLTALAINDSSVCDKILNSDSSIMCSAFVNLDEAKCSFLSIQNLRNICIEGIFNIKAEGQ